MTSKKHLIKASSAIGATTLFSRILGFIRDIIIAKLFGTTLFADAFVVAFRIPNLLRDLVGEGAMNSAIVPVLTSYIVKKDEKEYWEVANILLNISLIVLMALTILGVVFAPIIVKIIGFGFTKDPEKLALTIKLTRIIFPFVLLVGLWAYAMGILNSLKSFAIPSLGPAVLNASIIICALFLCPNIGVTGLAIGVLAGGVLQLLIQIPLLYKKGMRIRKDFNFSHPAVKKIGRLMLPRIFGSAVYQINVLVDTMLASFSWIVGAGAVSAIYYANRLFQFPQAIFGFSIAQAALPTLSTHAAENDLIKFKETVSFSLRSAFLIMLPSAVGFMVLGRPIVKILFEHGMFSSYSTGITVTALFYYSIGLVLYSGAKILVTTFYSLHDTVTPAKVALLSLIVNIILSVTLMFPMKLGGLALAASISGGVNYFVLFAILRKKIGPLGEKKIAGSFIKVLSSSIVMGIGLYIISSRIVWERSKESLFMLMAVILFGVVLFFISSVFIFRAEEARSGLKWILKRK